MEDETGDTLVVTESDTYTVIVYNEQCDTSAQDSVTINFYQDANANPVDDIVTCDDPTGDEIEDFDLEIQTAGILGTQNPADFVVTYHASLADAQNGVNALTSPYNNISNPQTIYARIEDTDAVNSNSGCFAVTNFDLVISGPTPTATSVNFEVCDDMSRDGTELFDLDSHSTNILDGQDGMDFTVTYYATQADADAATNPLTSPYENTSNPQTIYARVESNVAFDCYATAPFDLIVNDVPYTTFADDVTYEVCPNATVPIEITAIANNYSESEVTIAWYDDSIIIPGETSLTLPVLVEGNYTIEVIFNETGCIYQETVNVIELETCVIPEGISPNGDGYNDTFDLSSYDVQTLEIYNRHGVLVYSKSNYTNQWVGQSDNGDQLPVGTYFYVMKYQGNQQKAAWVYLNY
jgi:gliding motility-associated-like protein